MHRYRLSYGYKQGLWKVPENACAESVYQAIKAGYRMFDSSSDYANEHESGKGLKRAIDEGLVKREDVFIVTKLWNTFKVSYAAALGGMQGGTGVTHASGQ
jgi:diketogulonate reductase-like aldo/keto reductase